MSKRIVSGIMLTLLLTGMLTLVFDIQPVKASKPLAPNGVHNMTAYESRIGEQGVLFEDVNLQMWVPASYENHSAIICEYLVAGYANLSSIFGDHEYPYKFSIEHYPPGSPYFWGGTDARGTIRYGYSNLEDDTPEWNLYGVPHVRGYYEEMAHCFVCDFGVRGEISVGFYETLGLVIGSEVTLRTAYNPHIGELILGYYQVCVETTSYYLQHNTGPPGVGENIWPTRVLSHIFKTEVVDVYGWSAFINTFKYLQLEDYPLKQYNRDHAWGGFLNYLGNQTDSDLNTIFADYGLPSLQWFEVDGYQKSVMWIQDDHYSFRVKCFDREGDQPSDVKLHLYWTSTLIESEATMTFIGGNSETGWTFEANMTLDFSTLNYMYAFSANDGTHSVFQAVGLPTFLHQVVQPPHQHELAVILEAPAFLDLGDSSLLNATVYNAGLNNETDVDLFLSINGTEVNHVTIPELVNGTSYTIDYLWTLTVKGTYNLTAYAPPVLGENFTANNWHTKFARAVRVIVAVDPPAVTVTVGQIFSIDITITDVYEEPGVHGGLWCWIVRIRWNPDVLRVALDEWGDPMIEEGPFLSDVGSTLFLFDPPLNGSIPEMACSLIEPVEAEGSGTLATITFNATAAGVTDITIYETELYDWMGGANNLIPHTVVNGHVTVPSPLPLSVSMSPLSASINVGGSLTFTSTVSGGTPPHTYQWYLNDNPVSGATSSGWTFTPTSGGICHVYLKVTDAIDNTAQSETARITVGAIPVGGYSFPIKGYTTEPLTLYLALVAILTVSFTMIKRKTSGKQNNRRRKP